MMAWADANTKMPRPATVPARCDIPEADRWDLAPLYPDADAWRADLRRFQDAYPGIARFRGTLAESPERLLECLEAERDLARLAERLQHYAGLRVAEDGADDNARARLAELEFHLARAAETEAFLEPELMAIDDPRWDALASAPALAPWRAQLVRIRRRRPHTLGEPEERLLAMAGPALAGPDEIFGQLIDVDLRFGTLPDEQGREVELSHATYASLLLARDRATRRRAFRQYYAAYDAHRFTVAAALASSVKGDVFRARARRFPSALEAALFPDDMPVAVYDNLIGAVRENLDALHEYYEVRRRALALDEIRACDTYVPLVPEARRITPFDRAAELVLESLHPLGESYTRALRDGLAHRWCDRYESRGKRSGAFSSSSYGNPPYILMNYREDDLGSIYTLAHEAGHSMHSLLSMRAQPFQDAHYPIFLAEVASTFNEFLLTRHLLDTTTDRALRAHIVNRELDEIRGTLFRQTMFAEFERLIHAREEAGEALTLDWFRTVYRGLLEAYFGPRFTLDAELELECLRIPHFYSAFYVYKYATGISAAAALADTVACDASGAATQRYLEFLASGRSLFPLETLRRAGVDMSSPDPIRRTIDLFRRRLRELSELLG